MRPPFQRFAVLTRPFPAIDTADLVATLARAWTWTVQRDIHARGRSAEEAGSYLPQVYEALNLPRQQGKTTKLI